MAGLNTVTALHIQYVYLQAIYCLSLIITQVSNYTLFQLGLQLMTFLKIRHTWMWFIVEALLQVVNTLLHIKSYNDYQVGTISI